MLKRVFCVIFSVLLAMSVCISASALDNKIAEPLSAPDGLQFVFTYPNEGSECIEAVFTVPDDMSSYAAANAENAACCIQFDWSVDSRDAFHADATWDAPGGDYPVQQLNGSFVEKKEVFWFAYPEAAERCAGALTETTKDGATVRTFDFDAHQLYIRARFMVYTYSNGQCSFSDWSDVCDVGADKNAAAPKATDTGEDRPAVTDARLDNGTLFFTVQYPDSIQKTAQALLCSRGAMLSFESQLRTDSGEWQYWLTENSEQPYLTGRSADISELADAETIEYRCRLTGNNPENGEAVITGWSDYVTVKDGAVEIVENDDPFGKKAEAKRLKDAEREANKCKLCGICPIHPFGVCMFIWLAVILLVVLAVVYNILAVRKKKQREAEVKVREEASRRSAPDKTGSFVQTDRITLQKKDEPQAEEPAAEEPAAEEPAEETQEDEADEA